MPDASSLKVIINLLNEYGLSPKKALGQNFLMDKNILNKIVSSLDLNAGDYIVEIGPGLGVLTQALAERACGVLAIDVDVALKPLLYDRYGQNEKIKFLFKDILKTNIEEELKASFGLDLVPAFKVCANIPYNITSPIIFHLLHTCAHMTSATLMMQKEVARRLLAKPGSKDYGRLTVTAAYHAAIELVMPVSRNCFYPRPEVDSAVVRITPFRDKPYKVLDEAVFNSFIKAAFSKRRKTILNICSDFFALNKQLTQELLEAAGIGLSLRPEDLSLGDFVNLVNLFMSRTESNQKNLN